MRANNRANDQMRPVTIQRGYAKYAEGSALITLGDTVVLCTATIKEEVPQFLRNRGQGWITSEYGMLPRCAPARIPREASRGRVSGRTHEIQRLIGRSLRAAVNLSRIPERTIWLDCDVIQADGGTRTASVTGSFVALADALRSLVEQEQCLPCLKSFVAATSVGVVDGEVLLDLDYAEDSTASVDMNVVMTEKGEFVEVQGTAEMTPFNKELLDELLDLAKAGILDLIERQKEILGDIKHLFIAAKE